MPMTRGMHHDRTHGTDGRKVTLTGKDLEDAERLLSLLAQSREPTADRPSGPEDEAGRTFDRDERMKRAKRLFAARRRRTQLFGKAMFGEPAWDMLLALYITDSERRQTIGQLTQLAENPGTTALRWLDYLEREGLVERESHPTDRRAVFMRISDKGQKALDSYFSELLASEA